MAVVISAEYVNRNLREGIKKSTRLPSYGYDGLWGRGLDDAGVKSIYGKDRGIHYEGVLNGSGTTRGYPGMVVRIAPQAAVAAGVGAIPSVAMGGVAIAADALMPALTVGAANLNRKPLMMVLVEDDIRGIGPDVAYLAGQRVQAEIFPRGSEIWAAVESDVNGGTDMVIGQELSIDSTGYFQRQSANNIVSGILNQVVKKSNTISGLAETAADNIVALARVIIV